MTFRTPRRRSSPRTRRKYIVLRNFFKRTGNHSEPDIKINSSVNTCADVSDTKLKDIGVGGATEKLNDYKICVGKDSDDEIDADVSACYEPKETRILFNTGTSEYQVDQGTPAPDDRRKVSTGCRDEAGQERRRSRARAGLDVKSEHSKLRKHKSRRGDSAAFRSLVTLVPECGEEGRGERTARKLRNAFCDLATYGPVADRYKSREPLVCHEDVLHYGSERKTKREFDEDFIARIIKKQYKPVKIFDKLNSDLSQYSVPVCRDRSHKLRRIKEHTELFCLESASDRDISSTCDARHRGRHRHRPRSRPPPSGRYYDTALYDVVPVKEQSSPKSRRKFQEENINSSYVYRDIPPSPKSQRPRLNLESRYVPDSDDGQGEQTPRRRDQLARHLADTDDHQVTVDDVKCVQTNTRRKQKLPSRHFIHPEDLYLPDLQSCQPTLDANVSGPSVENNGNLCGEQPSGSADNADKTLGEIKEILQNFLQEIKKENISTSSENKSETNTPKPGTNEQAHMSFNGAADGTQHARAEFPSSAPRCDMSSVIPPYNPCCYPVLPFYPMSCMQSPYVLPSGSVTCPMCAHTPHSVDSQLNNAQNKSSSKSNSLTQELIKEIYRCVTHKPPNVGSRAGRNSFVHDLDSDNNNNTPRSSPRTPRSPRHDAQVGTPRLNSHSKSCEAFGSKIMSETYIPIKAQGTISDSVLEKRSVDRSVTQSDSEISSDESVSSVGEKKNKFKKILKSLGLMKKKKATKPTVELEESVHSVRVARHPFEQNMMSYMMHGQELYMRPPEPHPATHLPPPPNSEFYTSGEQYYHSAMFQQHAPLCLKEIEVKSTATQSEYKDNEPKKSFFSSLKSKFQNAKTEHAMQEHYLTSSTQTKPTKKQPEKMSPFFWKSNWNVHGNVDPLKVAYNEQKLLATGHMKLKNDLLKKLFYKRNPFSPRNMIVRSLLGKDKTNYGVPAGAVFKPKMFF